MKILVIMELHAIQHQFHAKITVSGLNKELKNETFATTQFWV